MLDQKKAIHTNDAPAAIGPYSQAIRAGDFLFLSGQLPINPKTGKIETFAIQEQTQQVLSNLQAILKADGLDLSHVVRCDIFLKNLEDFSIVNTIYSSFFTIQPQPARQTVQVSRLPQDALIEISCIAYRG
jgi:2-iminobutanoate/2-iminopropanoate deaminase